MITEMVIITFLRSLMMDSLVVPRAADKSRTRPLGHTKHDLAVRPASCRSRRTGGHPMNPWQVLGDVLPGLGRILERVYGRDVWSYRPLFQQSRDSAEHVPCRRESHHLARHTVPRGLFLRYGLGGRDQMAAFLQDEERPLLCIATDQVEDHIDLVSQNLLELRLSIVDNPAGSDGLDVRLIVAPCRGNDGGTGMRCQLHRIGAHSAGTSMDQDRLSLFQVTVGEDSLPRGLGRDRH